MSFRNRLIMARNAKNYSQSELARQLGLTPQAVQKWESATDSSMPRMDKIQRLAKLLEVTEAWLLTGMKLDLQTPTREELMDLIDNQLKQKNELELKVILDAIKSAQ